MSKQHIIVNDEQSFQHYTHYIVERGLDQSEAIAVAIACLVID